MSDETPNGNGVIPSSLRTAAAELRALESSVLLARARFAQQSGLTFNGARDEYVILGYDPTITIQQYRDEYMRGGIAGRVVDVMPDATWRGEPAVELVEDEDPQNETPFEKAWTDLDRKHQICSKLHRVDKLSRLSTYAILLIGDGGDLSKELRKVSSPDKLLYLMPFLGGGGPGGSTRNQYRTADFGSDATIFEYETDSSSPRFGLPLTYTIKRTDLASPALQRPVHWSRVIHVAEGVLDDEVFGQPALERVWNLLIDLRKVTGGGAEAFWLRANQGLHIDIDKDMALPDVSGTVAALKEQAEEYKHQQTRWLRTRGVKVETLGSDVANFDNPADAIITQIAGAKGIPKRILTGSEMGELASSQDRENFRDLIIGRQLQYAGPYIVRQLADRLIKYGYLPTPAEGEDKYEVKWSHIQVLTEIEKAQGAQAWASVNQTQAEVVFTDAEIRDKWAGYEPLTDEQRQEITDRADERAQKQQEMMAAGQPGAPPVDESSLDFNVDGSAEDQALADKKKKEQLKAAEDGEEHHDQCPWHSADRLRTASVCGCPPGWPKELRTALVKFEENKHPRADSGEFGSGGGGATPADHANAERTTNAVRSHFKAGLVNLHLKLSDGDAKKLTEVHAKAVKAGFTGSELEFFRQQLALNLDPKGDPAITFDKKTIAKYKDIRTSAIGKATPKPVDDSPVDPKKVGPDWKPEMSGNIAGYRNTKTGNWVPANHPDVKKSAEPEKKAKPAVPPSKRAPKGSKKDEPKKSSKKSDPVEGLDALVEGMKDDEKKALDEGYTKAKGEGFEGDKMAFLKEQLDLYGTAEEGDKRLKTFFYGATLDAYKKIAKNRAAQAGKSYKLSSTQIQLPPLLADALLRYGKSIPAFDLCEEEGGLEDDPHITVKYGLHTNNAADVRRVLATYVGPIRFTFGKTDIFEGDGYDVLYVEVISPDLEALNARLSNNLDNTNTQAAYIPHATVAYLKQAHGVRYVGDVALEGLTSAVGVVRFSPADGPDDDLRITGRAETGQFAIASPPVIPPPELIAAEAREDIEILRILKTAIEVGATDVVDQIVGLKRDE